MKKVYNKPEILFESFASSTNIAANCKVKIEGHSQGTCPYKVSAGDQTWSIFTGDFSVCTTNEADLDNNADGAYNGICYDVPFDGNSLFNS